MSELASHMVRKGYNTGTRYLARDLTYAVTLAVFTEVGGMVLLLLGF